MKIKYYCDWCGKINFKKPCDFKKCKNHFCNMYCDKLWRRKYLIGNKSNNWKGGKVKIICANCNKDLLVFPYELKINKKHFCNMACYGKWLSKNNIGKNNPNYNDGRAIKKYYCIDCKKQISRGGNRCRLCANSGKNNPSYIHGKSKNPYPKEFRDIEDKIRKRDNYKCKNCGLTQKSNLIKFKRKLSVHHIDYNKFNFNPKFLITLCDNCHGKTNDNRDYWFAYFAYKLERLYDK